FCRGLARQEARGRHRGSWKRMSEVANPTAGGAPVATSEASTLSRLRELTLIPAIIIAVVAGSFLSDAFLTRDNILNILQQSSELSVLVIAQSLVLIAGKFDLSLESTVGLAPMVAAWLMLTNTTLGGSGVGLDVFPAIVILFA